MPKQNLLLIHKIKHSIKSASANMPDIRRFCRIAIIYCKQFVYQTRKDFEVLMVKS